MKVKDFKKLINAFDSVKDTDFIKECWTYNKYIFWAGAFTGIIKLEEVENGTS